MSRQGNLGLSGGNVTSKSSSSLHSHLQRLRHELLAVHVGDGVLCLLLGRILHHRIALQGITQLNPIQDAACHASVARVCIMFGTCSSLAMSLKAVE